MFIYLLAVQLQNYEGRRLINYASFGGLKPEGGLTEPRKCVLCSSKRVKWIRAFEVYVCKDCFINTENLAGAIQKKEGKTRG